MSTERHVRHSAQSDRSMGNRGSRESHIEQLAGYEHGTDAPLRATRSALARVDDAGSIVLVEGISDQIAIETLAERLGRRLADERVVVVPIGGAQAAKHFISRFSGKAGVKLSGLCDRAESGYFARALADHGLVGLSTDLRGLESQGFYVCDADLEDELIRSIDASDIESVLAAEGDLGAFRTFQKQPVWRDRPFHAQMHRWLGSVARRKSRFARLLVLMASLDRMPRPLAGLMQHI